jgi:hypothetical protein
VLPGLIVLGILGLFLIVAGQMLSTSGEPAGEDIAHPQVITFDSLDSGLHRLRYYCRPGVLDRSVVLIEAAIEDTSLRAARSEFGYSQDELNEVTAAWIRRFLERKGYAEATVRVTRDSVLWRLPQPVSASRMAALRAGIQVALAQNLDGFYGRHLLFVDGDYVCVDFPQVHRRNVRRVACLAESLEAFSIRRGASPRQRLAIYLRFIQGLPYEVPSPEDGSRRTFGFWTPPEVAVRGQGDCDCKTLLFSALWATNHPGEVIAVDIPGHLFLGVRGYHARSSREVVWRVGGVDYLLCETTGFGWQPGEISRRQARMVRGGNARAILLD